MTENQVTIQSKAITMVPIGELHPRPANPNKHSDEQIERLCKIIKYQGFRDPLIVSTLSGFVVSGHGRLIAAEKIGMLELPVIYQDFLDSDQEYAAVVSENSIASWSDLDLGLINAELPEFDPSFDIDLLGLKEFALDPSEIPSDNKDIDEEKLAETEKECPSCGFKW